MSGRRKNRKSDPGPTPKPEHRGVATVTPFRPEALAFHARGPQRSDVLHITPQLLHAVFWFVIALVAVVLAFVSSSQVTDYAEGPALVLLDNRHDVTASRAGVVVEVRARAGAHVQEGDVLLQLHSATEAAELASLERELSDQLVLLMRNPADRAARDSVLGLRTRRDVAKTALERSVLRAPISGTVTDLRARAGQMVEAGAPLLALQAEATGAHVTALLPGPERPRLRPGMPMRLHIDGFDRTALDLEIERVDEQVLGPPEALRVLGSELAGAIDVQGPVVLVHAYVPDASFHSRGNHYRLHHGMPTRAEVAVAKEPLLYAWIPGLGEALSDVF
ncbi:MAG TPA: HlyD family efflux transporter periplasmic adaptor subunit [Polyangiales bacterium]|nr:HlyD family efflux transporter periplasmic adaptor subunit [Polyangiales bacterium]